MAMSLTLLLKSAFGGSGGGGKQTLEALHLVVGLTSLDGKENPLLSQNKL